MYVCVYTAVISLQVGGVSYHHYRGAIWDEIDREKVVKDLGPKNKVCSK